MNQEFLNRVLSLLRNIEQVTGDLDSQCPYCFVQSAHRADCELSDIIRVLFENGV